MSLLSTPTIKMASRQQKPSHPMPRRWQHKITLLTSGAVNPSGNTKYHWFRVWCKNAFGDAVDPLINLAEKEPPYLKQGKVSSHLFYFELLSLGSCKIVKAFIPLQLLVATVYQR